MTGRATQEELKGDLVWMLKEALDESEKDSPDAGAIGDVLGKARDRLGSLDDLTPWQREQSLRFQAAQNELAKQNYPGVQSLIRESIAAFEGKG